MTQPAPSHSCPPQHYFSENCSEEGQGVIRSAPASAAINPFKLESSLSSNSSRITASAASWQLSSPAQSVPLRGRDLQILTELFNQNEIEAIESDILLNLDRLCPEPCWEDDPFEFLREYL